MFLISDCCGSAKPSMSGAISRQGCIIKQTEKAMRSKAVFLHGSASVPTWASLLGRLPPINQINLFLTKSKL